MKRKKIDETVQVNCTHEEEEEREREREKEKKTGMAFVTNENQTTGQPKLRVTLCSLICDQARTTLQLEHWYMINDSTLTVTPSFALQCLAGLTFTIGSIVCYCVVGHRV